ncbi:MAG: hypothetical protein V1840_00450 [Candidatus Omnitrophota bacterium]
MNPTPVQLKQLNLLLDKFADKEINSLIDFLNDNDFIWLHREKIFYHQKLCFSIRTMGLDLFINNHDFVKKQITEYEAKYRENPRGYDATISEISLWKIVQRSSLVFGLLGLLFGRFIFSNTLWIFYLTFCFLAFIVSLKIQGRLLNKINSL